MKYPNEEDPASQQQPRKRGVLEKAALVGGGLYAAKTAANVIGGGIAAGAAVKGYRDAKKTRGKLAQGATQGSHIAKVKGFIKNPNLIRKASGAFLSSNERRIINLEARLDEALRLD